MNINGQFSFLNSAVQFENHGVNLRELVPPLHKKSVFQVETNGRLIEQIRCLQNGRLYEAI